MIEIDEDGFAYTRELPSGHAESLTASLDDEGLFVSVTLHHRKGHLEQQSITIPREHVPAFREWLDSQR